MLRFNATRNYNVNILRIFASHYFPIFGCFFPFGTIASLHVEVTLPFLKICS